MRRLLIVVLASFLALHAGAQDQQARPPSKDARGLLKINREYFDLAAKTGGDFYLWAPGEFAASRLDVPIHGDDVILAYGTLEGRRTFEVPIDGGVEVMTLFASMQRKDLVTILRPDGTVTRAGDDGVALQTFQYMTIVSVLKPTPGFWRVDVDGEGMFALTVHVRGRAIASDLKHRAFFREDGTRIQVDSDADGVITPSLPHRKGVIGTDASGHPFQRVEHALIEP